MTGTTPQDHCSTRFLEYGVESVVHPLRTATERARRSQAPADDDKEMVNRKAKPPLATRTLNRLYALLLRRLVLSERAFLLCQKCGFHVTQNHYYQPVPDTAKLLDDLWLQHSELAGLDMNELRQMELLSLFQSRFRNEYELLPRRSTGKPHEFYLENGAFVNVDAEILYCMIRHFKPRRIYEIGSGMSTLLSAQAVLRNEQDACLPCDLVAIEPYPNDMLQRGFPGLSRLVQSPVENVPLSEFNNLSENDILFIDSSHVLRIGNDVQYEYLELLPRLNRGVVIHVHDIFMPAEYPKEWVIRRRLFWTEQYLLQAFLSFNNSFEVLWAGAYMHLKNPEKLEAAFSSYDRNRTRPGSFWIRKTK